ncbi:MAG TPA: MBL fold metallo-hydrolase [Actinomycetota bacterium]|nr:MBL fold metallo-hydrolase [Actinomycetota bacterium]
MSKPIDHRKREPAPGIFRLVLPLPFPGLDRVNAFLLQGRDGYTLVDCGIYLPDAARDHGWDDVLAALAGCEVDPASIDRVVVTHPHIDHYGMAGRTLRETGADLCMHPSASEDLELYRDPHAIVERLREMFIEHGVEEDELAELTQYEDWRPFVSEVVDASHPIEDGEVLTIGARDWEVVYTPGHARSHICLWSAADRILISGDHLLPTITPHIDFKRGVDDDPLGDFLDSLDKVERLDPQMVLPGHGGPFDEGAERARVVARHHDRRLGSILQVIRHRPASADTITDELFGDSLLNFEHRLALGEALAHLAYLHKRGEIERVDDGDKILYQKVKRRRPDEQ